MRRAKGIKLWRAEYSCGCIVRDRLKKNIPVRCPRHSEMILSVFNLADAWLAAL